MKTRTSRASKTPKSPVDNVKKHGRATRATTKSSTSPSTSSGVTDGLRRSTRKRTENYPLMCLESDESTSPKKKGGQKNVKAIKGTPKKTSTADELESEVETPVKARRTRGNSQATSGPAPSSVVKDSPKTAVRSLRKRRVTLEKEEENDSSPKSKSKSETATLPVKDSPKTAKPNQALAQGKKLEWKFNIYGIPKCPLPCREAQFEEIWKFLFENITEKNSGCMYVSGVPGTGKTVIVQAVVDTMQKLNAENKKKLDFKYLYINGLSLASPDKIWKRMFKGLQLPTKSSGISSKEALKRLVSYFESHERSPVVLVVDELDQILDKQQSILYQLLEWSSHSTNMFSFVAIFNTMSLPEHGLAMRNYSRMGFKRAVFPPYSYDELQTIVQNMLDTFKSSRLSPECVSLLSRKVAAISGDARRALEIARRTLEIAESGNFSGIQAVSHAFKEIFSSAKIETIKHTSFLEQIVLKTICDQIRFSGVEEVLIAKVYENVLPKAVYEGVQYHKDDVLKALMRLAVMRLVMIEDNCPSLHKRLLLKVPVEDVNFALGCHLDLQTEN